MFAISNKSSFIPKILKVVGTLGEKFKLFILLGLQFEKDLNYINKRIKLQSLRVLKRYLNDENLIHDT